MNAFRFLATVMVLLAFTAIASAGPVINTGLLAYYSFDDSGSLAADGSGNGHNGAIVNNANSLTGSITYLASGKLGGAAYFGNENGLVPGKAAAYIDLPTLCSNTNYTGISLSVWYQSPNLTNQELISAYDANTAKTMVLHSELRNDGKYRFVTRAPAGTTLGDWRTDAGTYVPSADWHHLVMTYDSAAAKETIYLDNKVLTDASTVTVTTSPSLGAWASSVCLGATADTYSRPFAGYVDEVYVFNRAITGGEVQSLYAAATVPEPSSIALIVAGLASIFVYAWRRRKMASLCRECSAQSVLFVRQERREAVCF
jgi:hypothetical protein